jgi:hypothetical protein
MWFEIRTLPLLMLAFDWLVAEVLMSCWRGIMNW